MFSTMYNDSTGHTVHIVTWRYFKNEWSKWSMITLYCKWIWDHVPRNTISNIMKSGIIKYPKYKNRTDLSCSCLLQWGFHSLWISADLKMCWTTRATSTSTQRRVYQWECGMSFVASLCVHAGAPVLEKTLSACIFGPGGSSLNRASIYSFGSTRPTQTINCIVKHKRICCCCSVFPLASSWSLCLIGIRSLPANAKRP